MSGAGIHSKKAMPASSEGSGPERLTNMKRPKSTASATATIVPSRGCR